ncbi:hypothetical protein [Cardinium endosymbiont of Philonthus spinipes]|uniref:hypothetical protein n=1 Tax=Cardinium endosymbiont of Philonthus spinipes TaxID=3077941 RepID=UPI00313AFED3
MKTKVLILTTTEPGNPFPENFSCWCAGALEAKGYDTKLETISLDKFIESSQPLEIQQEQLTALQDTLSMIEKLVLILPEHNNMIPAGLDNFIALAATMKDKYTLCKLIAIVMDPVADKGEEPPVLFRYPLHKLDLFFGPTLSANRIRIRNSPTGNMCPLFAESYNDLCRLVEQIVA